MAIFNFGGVGYSNTHDEAYINAEDLIDKFKDGQIRLLRDALATTDGVDAAEGMKMKAATLAECVDQMYLMVEAIKKEKAAKKKP